MKVIFKFGGPSSNPCSHTGSGREFKLIVEKSVYFYTFKIENKGTATKSPTEDKSNVPIQTASEILVYPYLYTNHRYNEIHFYFGW